MPSPTLGFSVGDRDRDRLERLAGIYAHGNRSEWLRQALDLFEHKELVDTLARLQRVGDRTAATAAHDRSSLERAVSELLQSPSPRVVERAHQLVREAAEGTGDAAYDAAPTPDPAARQRLLDDGHDPE